MRRRFALLAWVLVASGCNSGDEATCVEGHQIACACPGGAEGVQTCTKEGKYGPCQCSAVPDGGMPSDSGFRPDSSLDGDSSGHDTGAEGDHDPIILSLSTNSQALSELDTLVITAVVSDPDGIDDVIGGRLIDKDTGGTYGSFTSSAQEGSYQISLTLDQILVVHRARGETVSVTFVAEFFDQGGHTARGEVQVEYHCSEEGYWLCGGDTACEDVQFSSSRCGDCDTHCSGDFPACLLGQCVYSRAGWDGESCNSICSRHGQTCVVAVDDDYHEMPCSSRGAAHCGCAASPGCTGPGPENTAAACTDGCSNDGDRYIDCEDYDCCDVVTCPQGTACNP